MHPKTEKNPRGAGRPTKWRSEEERRAARRATNRRYDAKARQGRVRVATYVDAEEGQKLQAIMAREGLPSMAAAVRWLISQHA